MLFRERSACGHLRVGGIDSWQGTSRRPTPSGAFLRRKPDVSGHQAFIGYIRFLENPDVSDKKEKSEMTDIIPLPADRTPVIAGQAANQAAGGRNSPRCSYVISSAGVWQSRGLFWKTEPQPGQTLVHARTPPGIVRQDRCALAGGARSAGVSRAYFLANYVPISCSQR